MRLRLSLPVRPVAHEPPLNARPKSMRARKDWRETGPGVERAADTVQH